MTASLRLPLALLLLGSSLSLGQDVDYTDECPQPYGFYADAVQCDRYYECNNGQVG